MGIKQKIGELLNVADSRVSLVLNGGTIMTSFGLPAWAVYAMDIFSQYSPLSWVLAGFLGLFLWVTARLLWVWGSKTIIKLKYDARMIESGDPINPLDLTFEGKRIYIDDLVLPSHPIIIGKTFVNCDLVGPAVIYFPTANQATEIRPPKVDGVWLDPSKEFYNGFTFINCVFRGCSFQRITILASVENYDSWKDNENLNWISIPPNDAHTVQRNNDLLALQQRPEEPHTQEIIVENTLDSSEDE